MPRELKSLLIIFDLNLLWVTFYAVVVTEVLLSNFACMCFSLVDDR